MLPIIKQSLITLVIFLVSPIVIIAINWQWQPESLNYTSEYLFWVTETAGKPWAILTCIFFVAIFSFILPVKSKKQFIKLLLILFIAVALGQLIKSVIKNYTAESRPYVLWIENNYQVDDEYFYSLPSNKRQEIIKDHVYNSPQIPNWLYQHWLNETGYTFPSGHALFAASWAFLALLLLNFKRHYVGISFVITWAVLIEISRIALGMHRPIDVIMGSTIAWGISLFCYYLAIKWRLIIK